MKNASTSTNRRGSLNMEATLLIAVLTVAATFAAGTLGSSINLKYGQAADHVSGFTASGTVNGRTPTGAYTLTWRPSAAPYAILAADNEQMNNAETVATGINATEYAVTPTASGPRYYQVQDAKGSKTTPVRSGPGYITDGLIADYHAARADGTQPGTLLTGTPRNAWNNLNGSSPNATLTGFTHDLTNGWKGNNTLTDPYHLEQNQNTLATMFTGASIPEGTYETLVRFDNSPGGVYHAGDQYAVTRGHLFIRGYGTGYTGSANNRMQIVLQQEGTGAYSWIYIDWDLQPGWKHIAVTYTTSGNVAKAYVNGQLVHTAPLNGWTSTNQWMRFFPASSTAQPSTGAVSYARWYNRPLTQQEVQHNYAVSRTW